MTPDELRARTKAFAVAIIKFCKTLPNDLATRAVVSQLVRCAGSVGANYRAACLAKSTADMVAKLKIVEEESDECGFWLEVLIETNLASADQVAELRNEALELFKIMSASVITLRKRSSSQS